MNVEITKALLLRAASALEQVARDIQGQSTHPDFIYKEDTQEWEDAAKIRAIIKLSSQNEDKGDPK